MTTRRPLPSGVYWRRRVFVLGTVVALVLLAVNLVRDVGDEPAATGDSATPVAAAPSARPSADPRAETRKERRKRKQREAEPAEVTPPPEPEPAVPTGPCEDSDVRITPSVPGAVEGQPVGIRLTLQSVAAEACTWTLDADHLALKVTDGASEIWASRECRRQVPASDVVVRRDLPADVTLTWNARYSSEGCPARPTWVTAGTYYLQAAALGGEPSDVVEFELLDASAVVVPDGPIGPGLPAPDVGRERDRERGKNRDRRGP